MKLSKKLPKYEEILLSHSKKLEKIISDEIDKKEFLYFDDYMNLALYAPIYGYYSSNKYKFGNKGDFITAPELTSIFAKCFSNSFQSVIESFHFNHTNYDILEIGAGSGKFASDVLQSLKEKGILPKAYYILELSADLKNLQKETILNHTPELMDRICWLDKLPQEKIQGIIFANEVLDAMAVCQFIKEDDRIFELGITKNERDKNDKNLDKSFKYIQITPREKVLEKVVELEKNIGKLPNGYRSEINLFEKPWLESLSSCLNHGMVYLVDYGYEEAEFYREDRINGTLQCYFKHHVHDNPLIYAGIQDITAHVNFTSVANNAVKAGFELEGYSNQSYFLAATGIDQIYAKTYKNYETKLQLKLAQEVKTLMMPGSMGEVFKVMALSKRDTKSSKIDDLSIKGFDLLDLSYRL